MLPRAQTHADPRRPPRFGPLLRDGAVRFQAFAPRARRVEVLLEGKRSRRVRLDDIGEGFFAADVEGAAVGTRYRLRRDGSAPVADPASRWQPLGTLGPSEVIDERALARAARGEAQPRGLVLDGAAVIYELHVGTFSARGDYDGVRGRIDHLVELGVGAIKLMPLATFPGERGWGYDGVLHFAPHPAYGEPAALARLVRALHQRSIAVLLDVVTNHFGPEHNAMWSLARRFFEPERPTPWASGINYSVEAVNRYFDEMARYWLDVFDLDGLRYDAWNAMPRGARHLQLSRAIEETDALRPAPSERRTLMWLESSGNEHKPLGPRGVDSRVDVMQLNFDVHRAAHAQLTGERHGQYVDYQRPIAELERCLTRGFAFAERHSEHKGGRVGDRRRPLPWTAFLNYLENHDTCGNRYFGERHAALAAPQKVRALLALIGLHPAPLYLFAGQEWQSQRPFYFFTDFDEGFGAKVTRARLAEFEELDWRQSERRAPGPQEPPAFEDSRVAWSELRRASHREALDFTRALLALRRRVVPQMARGTDDVSSQRRGHAIALTIAARRAEARYLLVTNLGDDPLARSELDAFAASRAPSRRLHCSAAPAGASRASAQTIAPWCTELWR